MHLIFLALGTALSKLERPLDPFLQRRYPGAIAQRLARCLRHAQCAPFCFIGDWIAKKIAEFAVALNHRVDRLVD